MTRDLARRLVPRPLRNLLRSPRDTARWYWRRCSYGLGYRPTCRVRADWQVRHHPASADSFLAMRDREDDRYELAGFVAHCAPGMVLLDIGAHYGALSLAALHFGGPEARVVAVDPSAEACRVLRVNLDLAGAADRAEVVEAAVGEEDGRLAMLSTGPMGDNFLVFDAASRPDATSVPQFTIESLVARTGLEPTHVKVDVEGYEGEVLRGGRRLLRDCGPVLYLELHGAILRGRGHRPEDVLAMLAELGYDRLEWHGRPISPGDAAALDLARIVCSRG